MAAWVQSTRKTNWDRLSINLPGTAATTPRARVRSPPFSNQSDNTPIQNESALFYYRGRTKCLQPIQAVYFWYDTQQLRQYIRKNSEEERVEVKEG